MRKAKTKKSKRNGEWNRGEAALTPEENVNKASETTTDPPARSSLATDDSTQPRPEQAEATAVSADPIKSLEDRAASLEQALLRAKADYQNLQRRCELERSEAIRYANAELMRQLVGVVDDFERALDAVEAGDDLGAVGTGVRLVYENLMKALRSCGLETIEAAGQPFDPHIHEAMMQQPSTQHPAGYVVEEISKGYRLRERTLRPAKVVVSQAANAHDSTKKALGNKASETPAGHPPRQGSH